MTKKQFDTYELTKEKHFDKVCLFRVGSQCKAYGKDAVDVVDAVNHYMENNKLQVFYEFIGTEKKDIQTTGFDICDLDTYLPKILRCGYTVIISEL